MNLSDTMFSFITEVQAKDAGLCDFGNDIKEAHVVSSPVDT